MTTVAWIPWDAALAVQLALGSCGMMKTSTEF